MVRELSDISVIILVGREERHIGRCLERLRDLNPRQVFVVESQKGDRTHEVAVETAEALKWRVCGRAEDCGTDDQTLLSLVWHDWPGLYARQFNWALDNLPISTGWVLRLDADEYLTEETMEKLGGPHGVRALPVTTVGITLELRRRFCGGEIRHATNGIRLLRIWRYGLGRSEERAMDEHIEVTGEVIDFDGAFYDDNRNDMAWWRNKHRGYAKREAIDALAFYRGELRFKSVKAKYYRMPPYFRAFAYFCIRYFLKGGFLDGYAGWMWNFWQGLWYRWIVDREIARMRRGV